MAQSNVNQLLIRNIDLLEGNFPLLVNLDANELFAKWFEAYPKANITCFSNNFGQYQTIEQHCHEQVKNVFGVSYEAKKEHDLVVVAFPKSKAELAFTLAMIAPAINEETCIVIVGDNKSGIKSVAKLSNDYLAHCIKQDSARHCLLYSARHKKPSMLFNLGDWFSYYDVNIAQNTIKIAALPGVFSQKGLDKGTKVLLDHLSLNITGSVFDFGCGAGVISAAIGKACPDVELTLADVSALAIKSSEETLKLNGIQGQCIATDGLSQVHGKFDYILSNPPFHQGIKTHYAATELFLSECAKHMTHHGSLIVVANSFLKYQSIMEQSVGATLQIIKENGFTVYKSIKK
jgi:16S rRNA (guanine1207-N2)-methyltransferase